MNLISFNFNGWMPVAKLSYSQKITDFSAHIKNAYPDVDIIAIQEFIPGCDGKYLNELRGKLGPEYVVLAPRGFDISAHPRSLLSITVVRTTSINGYRINTFPCSLPNRICDVTIFSSEGEVRILNVYQVQTNLFHGHKKDDWYTKNRVSLHNKMWQEIMNETERNNGAMVILGDLQEDSNGENIVKLNSMGYREITKNFPTTRGEFIGNSCIDHILFNELAWDMIKPSSFSLDGSLLDYVSDHVLLAVI